VGGASFVEGADKEFFTDIFMFGWRGNRSFRYVEIAKAKSQQSLYCSCIPMLKNQSTNTSFSHTQDTCATLLASRSE
jgi:hypothetical protein